MRRIALMLAIGMTIVVAFAPDAMAQDQPTPADVVIDEVDSPLGDIIPEPGSGTAPTDPGDRGGAQQLLLLAFIVGFFVVAVFSVLRSTRKARATTLAEGKRSDRSVELADRDIDT